VETLSGDSGQLLQLDVAGPSDADEGDGEVEDDGTVNHGSDAAQPSGSAA
jgi:hypothetical protein